MILCLRC